VGIAVIALTDWGERPVPSTHLAEALGLSIGEVGARAQGNCTIGTPVEDPEDTLFRVEDGLITFKLHFDPERPTRRQLQIGDRRVRTTVGCAPDVLLYAPLLHRFVQVEETCPATGTPMRLMFTPSGVKSVDPAGVAVPIPPPKDFDRIGSSG
jgi:alkylmercury lyase